MTALAYSNQSVMGKMQLKMANTVLMLELLRTQKKAHVNFMKGADASTTVVWPQEGVRIKDMNKESHRALYTQVTPIGRV